MYRVNILQVNRDHLLLPVRYALLLGSDACSTRQTGGNAYQLAHVLEGAQLCRDTIVGVFNADVGEVLSEIFFLLLELGEEVPYPGFEFIS